MATVDRRGGDETAVTLNEAPPLLFQGQRLDQPEFHDLYSLMGEDFRAELIDGVVYVMNMPLHPDHGRPGANVVGLLFNYMLATPGTIVDCEVTTKLAPRSEVQPDAVLRIDPAFGGRTNTDASGYPTNTPELVVEVALSSLRIDLDLKKKVYEEAGTPEYVVFDASGERFHWFVLVDGRFVPLQAERGVFRSRTLPGLWLDEAAFVGGDLVALMETLRRGLATPEHADFVARLAENRAKRP